MARSFQLRQVHLADLASCFAIEQAVFLPSEAATREQIETRIRRYPEGFIVAQTRAGIVGFVNSGCTTKDDIADEALKSMVGHDPTGAYIVIFSVAVLPDWQGLGIGRRLMHAIEADVRRHRKRAILLLCKRELIGFYERLGFVNGGASASSHGGFHWFQMKLPLTPEATG